MDTTPSSFTARNNAKRAAEKMIANGKAPAVDYGIRPRDDGRFEIVWKTVPTTGEVETEIATAATAAEDGHYSTNPLLSVNEDPSHAPPNAGGSRVMVRNKPRSWSEATIYTRLDAEYWRVQYPSGGTGMFKEGDVRAYDAERDAKRARQPRRAKAAGPRAASRSRYALDPAVIAAGKLPDRAPVVTSAANPHYQKRFDELHKLAAAGDWAAVRDYKVSGSNSYSKLVARYQQDLLALHAAWEAAQ
jgi:hypothetical protein